MKRQIKTKLSRILCIALALCMIAALIPATFAAITEESGAFTIDFKAFATVAGQKTAVNKASYESVKELWEYVNEYSSVGGDYRTSYGLKVDATTKGEYLSIKLTAPATGNYKIKYEYYQATQGGYGDIYIVPLTETINVLDVISGDSGKFFSEVCYYGSSGTGPSVTSDDYVSLSGGEEYLVVFATAKKNTDEMSVCKMYLTSLTFTPYEPINAVYSFAADDYPGVATPEDISYANSDGLLEFYGSDGSYEGIWNSKYACIRLVATTGWVAYKIRIPAAGEYKLTLDYRQTNSDKNRVADAYIIPASYGVDLTKATLLFKGISFFSESTTTAKKVTDFNVDSAGEYLFIFYNEALSTYVRPAKLTLSENSNILGDVGTVGGINDGETNVYIEGDEIALTYTANNSVDGTELTPEVSNVESSDTSVITIADINTANAVGAGKATITAKINGYPASWDVTVQSKDLVDAFSDVDASGSVPVDEKANINILTYSTDGTPQTYEATIEAEYNEPTSITAPAAPDGYTFLYWAKGATDKKQIIPGETITIYPTVETTYMIAVYAPTGAAAEDKVEFYNYNGQLLDCEIGQDGKMPPLPYMTGYGKADHWALYGTTDTYKGGDVAPETSGTAIFVAQYKDLEENITVTAENCIVNGGSSATVKFGDTVECVADGEGTFKWWTKTVNGKTEIVSLDKDYTFKAWETCTVTAVYGDKAPTYVGDTMRIILGTLNVGDEMAYMAEFVGLDRAVEKGIMLGTKKIAMSSKDNQFTVINDINDINATDIKGYAILANGTLITDK